jgi:hypothetical protein
MIFLPVFAFSLLASLTPTAFEPKQGDIPGGQAKTH